MMNKVLAERAMSKISKLKYEPLMNALQELADEFERGVTTELIDKLYALNFTIILAAQGRGINFQEYCNLMLELNYRFCGLENLLD